MRQIQSQINSQTVEMSLKIFLFCALLVTILNPIESNNNNSFTNIDVTLVTVHSILSQDVDKLKISSSNDLRSNLPNPTPSAIYLKGTIPVLYEGSVKDLNVQILSLEHNKMEQIEKGAFKNLDVNNLDLSWNNLTEIQEGIFNYLIVRKLALTGNKISAIEDKAFDHMPDLVFIELSNNKLKDYNPNWFFNTTRIYRLFFGQNLFESLPDEAFKNVYNEKKQWINLRSNKISGISEKTFKGLKNIDVLDLQSNNIQRWNDEILQDADVVQYLKLMDNKIECLDGDFDNIFKANFTYLYENPLQEDCKKKIDDWTKWNDKHIVCTSACNLY